MLLDYVEDVQDCEIIYEIVPFEISLPGDFCFTEESLCQMKGGEYPSASATYSGEDIRDNVVELKRTDFLECYDELSKGNEVPAIAMPLASLNEEGPSVVILVEGSRAETPIVLSRLESKERACSIADIAHYHGVENQESMTSSAVCMMLLRQLNPVELCLTSKRHLFILKNRRRHGIWQSIGGRRRRICTVLPINVVKVLGKKPPHVGHAATADLTK